ncbi:MAG: YcaO-like family protein [Actinomycetota bacterium]|nr:YcaO-like family protein [Actinomycetota bacterium]
MTDVADPFVPPASGRSPLVDAATGIVHRVWSEPLPSLGPPGLRLWFAQLSSTEPFGSPLGADTATGCTWWDDEAARRAAIGEAVEWYAANLVPRDLLRARARDLPPHERVDPAELALYSPDQLAADGFPFVPFTDDVEVRWSTGTALFDGSRRFVPASVVHLAYTTGATTGQPLMNFPVNAGIAAGADGHDPVHAALAEVVERDALAEAWTFGAPLVPLRIPWWFARELGAGDGAEWTFLRLPTRVACPGVLAVVRDRRRRLVGVGAAVRADAVDAARKASAEAMVALSGAVGIEHSDLCPFAGSGEHGGPLVPWREDRTYRSAYRDDWHDVVDITCHAQLYVDPAMVDALDRRLGQLTADADEVALEDVPTLDGPHRIAERLVAAGFDPVVVDVTTSDVRSLGWRVVRAVVPGLRATAPAAFPYLGETRRSRRHDGAPYLGPVPHV